MVDKHAIGTGLIKIVLCMCCLLMILFLYPKKARAVSGADVDLFFVIDNSGSMRKNDPNFMTPQTVRTFLQRLSPTTHVGMVMFDQKARLLEPLGPVSDAQANQRLMQSLEGIDYSGKFTDSAAGIERALYELKTSGRPASQRCMIFLTDGIVDTGNERKDAQLTQWLKNDLAVECRDQGVRIFGIAFTENADFVLIQALSQRTGGAYYRAFNPEDIAAVLDQIQSQLVPTPVLLTPTEPDQIQLKAIQPPAPLSSPVAIDKSDALEPAPETREPSPPSSGKGFFKFYLPLILIICMIVGGLFFLVYKIFGWPLRVSVPHLGDEAPSGLAPIDAHSVEEAPRGVDPMGTNLPEEAPGGVTPMDAHLPEWQLHDLEKPDHPATNFNTLKITIGRGENNDFVITQPTISNIHATIEYRDEAFFLEDQRSANGTRLNDRKVLPGQPIRLKSGDRIKFANHEYKFVRQDQLISGDTVLLEVTSFISEPQDANAPAATLRIDDEKHLLDVLKLHLTQIKALGPNYTDFVNHYLAKDTMRTLSIQAQENMQHTMVDGDQHCAPLVKGQAFYVVCTLPVAIAHAAQWFSERYGGFTKFVHKWLRSEAYDVTACDVFCMITFGCDQGHWVSMTIVPTHEAEDSVEIMSVDFLTDAEKASLSIDFDDQGRVS